MAKNILEVPLRHLLWRTRGVHWDYTFILTPVCDELSKFKDWYTLVEHRLPQGMTQGELPINDKTVSFVAAVWSDEKRKDSFGRYIQEKLMWFIDIGGKDVVTHEDLPEDWAKQIVSILQRQPCFRKLNSMSKQEVRTASPAAYFREKMSLEVVEILCRGQRKMGKVSNLGVILISEQGKSYQKKANTSEEPIKVLRNIIGSLMNLVFQLFGYMRK